MQNKDGSHRRNPTDNKVIQYGGAFSYKGYAIEYIENTSEWKLDGSKYDNISNLSTALSGLTKDSEFNRTTYKIGKLLEANGYVFAVSFDHYTENTTHSKTTDARPTFIITYNPKKWDETLIQKLIDQLNDGKEFVERWKFGSPKKCKVGDRVFLSRTGAIKSGLIGSGHIASPPRQERNFEKRDKLSWYVDVQFDYLAPTPDTVVINHEELSSLLGIPKRSFTPQQSGVSFKGDPKLLEEIWQSLTGTESFKYAEEIVDDDEQPKFSEGAKQTITVNKYERDPKARTECIRIHGYSCKVCKFDFEKVYGELGKEYIHVHHLTPLKDIGEKYNVDPEKDLIPVCPNCHAMLHKLDDPSDWKELRKILIKWQ